MRSIFLFLVNLYLQVHDNDVVQRDVVNHLKTGFCSKETQLVGPHLSDLITLEIDDVQTWQRLHNTAELVNILKRKGIVCRLKLKKILALSDQTR